MDGLIEGRMVHYVLTDDDASSINARRIASEELQPERRLVVGNYARSGDHCPAVVVRLFEEKGGESGLANLQVFLDGDSSYWATSCYYSENAVLLGTWHWIEKA